MKNLRYLYLNNNNLVGQIPLTIGHLTKLETLSLNWNMISGPIPMELANCSKRVNIIKDIAHVISYMHQDCIPIIVNQDISSNNILLNSKLEQAFVSNFGTARLLDPNSSNQTLVVGTYGYIAPGKLFFHTISYISPIFQHNILKG